MEEGKNYKVKFKPCEHRDRDFDQIVFVDENGKEVLGVSRGEHISFDTLRILSVLDKFE